MFEEFFVSLSFSLDDRHCSQSAPLAGEPMHHLRHDASVARPSAGADTSSAPGCIGSPSKLGNRYIVDSMLCWSASL